MDIADDVTYALKEIHTQEELGSLKRAYVGKAGKLKTLFQSINTLSTEEKRTKGKELNTLQTRLTELFVQKEKELSETSEETILAEEKEFLSHQSIKLGHTHPVTETVRLMNHIFTTMGYSIMEGPEVETDEFCLQRLNVPPNHPARDMQDTIYIKEPDILLRSQTSSVEARVLATYKPPFKVVIPGRVYRNEKVNKSNHFIFHQYQGVVVLEKTSLKELFGTFTHLFKAMYGEDVVIRYRYKYYPEVVPGAGPDMQCFQCKGKGCSLCKFVGWIEMGGSGMIHPHVLTAAGLDPEKWMGFAFGLGLDRWVMAKYNIGDIRSLLGGDIAYQYYNHEAVI